MKVSKYLKVDKDILLEYIYDSDNMLADSYTIINDSRTNRNSYITSDTSVTQNKKSDNLFALNINQNNYARIDYDKYAFLNPKSYGSGIPLKHDTIKIHLPINYNFGEYTGCYLRVYAYDFTNKVEHDICNYYYDRSEIEALSELYYTKPYMYYQDKIWGKYLQIQIPSVYEIAQRRENSRAVSNTLNHHLTNGVGFSTTSPIMIDFRFIRSKAENSELNDTIFNLTNSNTVSVPLAPEHESLGLKIEESDNGDFFEIYGIYNGNISEFKQFIDKERQKGLNYYVNYAITVYEEEIRGKTLNITLMNNFNEKVDYRPIIKYSTTTAIIDVVMSLINLNDGSSIIRTASYGMLQNQVPKYSLSLSKINIRNATKPKIYHLSAINNPASGQMNIGKNHIQVEGIKVPYPVMVDRKKIIAKSDSVKVGKDVFYGNGLLNLLLQPYDNIVAFTLAEDYKEEDGVKYMNLANFGNIKLCFKDDTNRNIECELFSKDGIGNDLENGSIQFLIKATTITEIKKVYQFNNLFYITSTMNGITSVIYSGRFTIFNDIVEETIPIDVENQITEEERQAEDNTIVVETPREELHGTAIVTRRYKDVLDISPTKELLANNRIDKVNLINKIDVNKLNSANLTNEINVNKRLE
jgi:hypothetical protein